MYRCQIRQAKGAAEGFAVGAAFFFFQTACKSETILIPSITQDVPPETLGTRGISRI